MTSYTKEHKSSRGFLMMVPVPAHQGNPNVILLEDSPPEVITIADDKNIHGSLLGSSASNIYDAKQFKRLKPKVRLHITLFSIIAGLAVITSVIIFLNVWNPDSPVGKIFSLNTKTELKVMSALDFKLLEPFHTSLNILGIDEKYEDFSFLQLTMGGSNIQHITLSGPISFQWFYFITRQFPALRSVTIDMGKYCSGAINSNYKIITFEGIKFTVRNFKRCNSNINDFFLSLQFPGIQYFVAEDSDSFFESYMLWIKIFKLVFDVPFPNPEVEIFNRRKEPFAEMH